MFRRSRARWLLSLLVACSVIWHVATQAASQEASQAASQAASPRGLLLVSIDGLAPAYVTDADRYGLKIPTLRRILRQGSHADGVRGVLPTVTYPNHTTLITGVWPAEHGIYQNVMFDPLGKNNGGWYWYSEDIRVPTLWDAAARAGYIVGSVSWPASVGAQGVNYLIPEFWRSGTSEDVKLLAALSTPGLLRELQRELGPYDTDADAGVRADWTRTHYAEAIIRQKHARFVTVHLAALDHVEHGTGPFSPESLAALESLDQMVAGLETAMRTEDPRTAICIVSDHGFVRSTRQLSIRRAFVAAGLMTVDPAKPGIVTDWAASPWTSGGGALIVLKNPNDSAIREKVQALLRQLAGDPANGIEDVLDRQAIAAQGGTPEAAFFVDMKPGFDVGNALDGPLVRDIAPRGDHGFAATHPEMRASFFIAGQSIRQGLDVGDIDMRRIAPTLAKLLGARLPTAPLSGLDIFTGSVGGQH